MREKGKKNTIVFFSFSFFGVPIHFFRTVLPLFLGPLFFLCVFRKDGVFLFFFFRTCPTPFFFPLFPLDFFFFDHPHIRSEE